MEETNEPDFEAEDCGCTCIKAGIDSEWIWDEDQHCYVCSGCNEVQ